MKKSVIVICLILAFLLVLTGCETKPETEGTDDNKNEYKIISQEVAVEMMSRDDGHIVLDVRTRDEFNDGHIPGAVCIPNEEIDTDRPAQLPDLEQIILIYCRSGNRSKKAAKKLCDMGYKNVYEFGGIITWEGEIVKEDTADNPQTEANTGAEAVLSFSSFDGGGPEYSVVLTDDTIVTYTCERRYGSVDHEEIDGAAYDVVFTFTGNKPGETDMTVEERSPIAGDFDHFYTVRVDSDLNVSIEYKSTADLYEAIKPTAVIIIATKNGYFTAVPENNSSAEEFLERLSEGELEIEMQDYGNFEKVGELPWDISRNDSEITTEPGDVILYEGNKLTIYYDENTWSFTKLAKITDVTREELLDVLGEGEISVTMWAEWSE